MTIESYDGPEPETHNNIPAHLEHLAEWAEAQLLALQTAMAAQATPAGAIMAWDDANAPATWHVLDGRAVSRVDNPLLFARYGTTHGAGNGSTTFNLPNRKGRALVGLDTGQTEFNAIGKTGGAKAHQLSSAEMPVHDHGGATGNGAGTYYGVPTGLLDGGVGWQLRSEIGGGYATRVLVGADPISTQANHVHGINASGGGAAHNNLQPYAVTNWIIKAG